MTLLGNRRISMIGCESSFRRLLCHHVSHIKYYCQKDFNAFTGTLSNIIFSLANHDLFWHNFTIDELGVDLIVPVGSEREAGFSAPPGTYTFYRIRLARTVSRP
jgi:hypothetical protein